MDEYQNKLKLYKLTKPELFGPQYAELTQTKMTKPWHKYDVTDYFNYGFNEHTLQIYVHKITQLSQHHRKHRIEYADKCERIDNIFDKAKQIRKLAKDLYPIDLGGIFVEVDEKMLKFKQPELENLYELSLSDKIHFIDQYRCNGESNIYKSHFWEKVQCTQKDRIMDVAKQHSNLYMFDQAIKIFPEQKQQSIMSLLYNPSMQQPIKKSRSRSPKKDRKRK